MAIVETKSIIKLIKDNNLLDSSYDESRLENDINTTFLPINYTNASELIKLIPAITPAQIKNRSDLNALVIDAKEAKEKLDKYKKYDETLCLKSVEDIKPDANYIIARIEYCKRFGYPYCDDNGEVYSEVIHSPSYLRRFQKTINRKFNLDYVGEYDYILEDLDDDKVSELIALIQNISIRCFHKLCLVTEQFEKEIEHILSTEDIDIKNLVLRSFRKLKNEYENQFIDTDLINVNYNFGNEDLTMDRRNGQR